jgi:hypothetical protein
MGRIDLDGSFRRMANWTVLLRPGIDKKVLESELLLEADQAPFCLVRFIVK